LVINPGYLSKRKGPGTYAKLTIFPAKITEPEVGSSVVGHNVFERAKVEILRI
jgi:DNA polymerase alpha subunit B